MNNRIIVYTDGSAIDNGSDKSRCGWAIKLIYRGRALPKSGSARGYTNNQMEMMAVFKAMTSITDKTIPVIVYSDSQYVVKTFNGEFAVGANEAMWRQLMAEKEKFADITFEWVRGHGANEHNAEVDRLAFEAARNAV